MPLTLEQHEKKLRNPALCEQLPVRDYLDGIAVRTNGSFVAGYELQGLTSYYASDEGRNRNKLMLEALIRSIPEQSMRLQLRYELVEDLGDLLDRYAASQRSPNAAVATLDETRVERWRRKEAEGAFARSMLHAYFIWDPAIHQRVMGKNTGSQRKTFSLSQTRCIERGRREHLDLLAEFESLMHGVESTMQAADLGARRLTDDELFLEAKRALNPFRSDTRPYKQDGQQIEYHSAREQIADTSIVEETDTYLNLDGVLYSFVSLKELPDATFPGVLRELVALDFPTVVNVQVTVPDQTKVLKHYKTRLRKMQAAQRDTHGGHRVNVEAQVRQAAGDARINAPTFNNLMELRFGPKRVTHDPSDTEANLIAVSKGYVVIGAASLTSDEWQNVRRFESSLPAGRVTPSPKPFSPNGKPLRLLHADQMTADHKRFDSFAQMLAREILDRSLTVVFADDPGWGFAGCYRSSVLTVNIAAKGPTWFKGTAAVLLQQWIPFLIHEFAHDRVSGHLSEDYHRECCRLAGILARGMYERPSVFDSALA